MPAIETRPFSLTPERLAWPSFLMLLRRRSLLYAALALAIAAVLWGSFGLSIPLALLCGLGGVAAALLFSFSRYKSFLGKPNNREAVRESTVRLDDQELRQTFTDGSHTAFQRFAIKSVRELGGFIFVSASAHHTIILPVDAFADSEEATRFADELREQCAKK